MSASAAFLQRLHAPDLDALKKRWTVRVYDQDETIIAHGDADRHVFFVLEGRARVTLYSDNGREITYRDVEAGEIFGELAGIDGKSRSASVVAVEKTRAAQLPCAAFRNLVDLHPTFAWTLLEHLSAQLRRMTERVYEYSTLAVRERLVLELLRQAKSAGQLDGRAYISPVPTHFELAAKISTHREAVSREMSALSKNGLIERSGGRLVLCNLAALEILASNEA